MASPITWQNVQNNGPAATNGAVNALDFAGKRFDSVFSGLGDMLKQREATDTANLATVQDNARQGFLGALNGAKTEQDLMQLQQSGGLEQFTQQMNAKNLAMNQGVIDGRASALRQQFTTDQNYQDSQDKRQYAPIVDQIAAFNALGTPEGSANADALIAKYPGMPGLGAVTASTVAGKRDQLKREHEATAYGRATTAYDQSQEAYVREEAARKEKVFVDQTIQAGAADLATSQENQGSAIRDIASKLGLPTTSDGLPDTGKLTPQQVMSLNDQMNQAGLNPEKSTSTARKLLTESLRAAGVTTANMQAALTTADSAFSNKSIISAEDQGKLTAANQLIDDGVADATTNNLFYTPPGEMVKAKGDVLALIDSRVKDGPGTRDRMRTYIGDWLEKGIEFKDPRTGKTVTQPVPPKIVEAAFNSGVETDTWLYNDTEDQMETRIKQMMQQPLYNQQRETADWLNADGHKREKIRNESKLQTNSGTMSASDWSVRFNKVLQEKQKESAANEKATASKNGK